MFYWKCLSWRKTQFNWPMLFELYQFVSKYQFMVVRKVIWSQNNRYVPSILPYKCIRLSWLKVLSRLFSSNKDNNSYTLKEYWKHARSLSETLHYLITKSPWRSNSENRESKQVLTFALRSASRLWAKIIFVEVTHNPVKKRRTRSNDSSILMTFCLMFKGSF